ncbi:MAG: hypothetical protein GF383_06050 [Candidatus Lokiarchaeota archaeon]|nr:hypothetical protein [Candidatus Lokiarchaeota archaeon]MBD3339505.1 hypothetical protein [Candidatus Lokiarchaeota archaeon]
MLIQESLYSIFFGNPASIALFIIFIIAFFLGTLLIHSQVSLVLKGEFSLKDRLQCIIYGFIFAMAVMVVLGMAFIFAVETPQFWTNSPEPPPEIHPFLLLIPFVICLSYVSFYPLIDFIFIALSEASDEGMTPFHSFIGSKIINKTDNKIISLLIALGLFFGVFFIPPLLISTFLSIPLILIWMTWTLTYPLMILTFYGSKGYIAGITNVYYHLPDPSRSIFLTFENGERSMKEFISDPGPRILLGLMLFVFVWAWISMIQTAAFYFTGALAISPYSYAGMVFVTLLFGIIGYFTRFWGRKIKYRGIDIYFAAYLMAAVGLNVLVNFLIVNAEKLEHTFEIWAFTTQIVPNYLSFAWAAVIEEVFLIIFTSYYFLTKKNEFTRNIKYAMISEAGQTFDPIPLFNFIKSKNAKLRTYAEETLFLMYERIPLKNDINLTEGKYKNFLIDGICDPHPNSKRICEKILNQLEQDVPEIVVSWIIEGLKSPNYEKSIPMARSLLSIDLKYLEKIPKELLLNLINDNEWRLRYIIWKVISRFIQINSNLLNEINVVKLINDNNSDIQAQILELAIKSSLSLPIDILISKINHKNRLVRAKAIECLESISSEELDEKVVSEIKILMKDPSSSVRASIFKFLANIGDIKNFSISLNSLLEGLSDLNKNVREASALALEKYYEESPEDLNLDSIINRIDPNNNEALNTILGLLGRLFEQNPEKILTTLLIFIKFDNQELKESISEILIEKYKAYPSLILENLIEISDKSTFITKGIISRTIIAIAKKDPKIVIPRLLNFLNSQNADIRLNAINSLEGLIDRYSDIINLKPIIDRIQKESDTHVKKEINKVIVRVVKSKPEEIKPYMKQIFQIIKDQETSIRISLARTLLEVARQSPEFLSLNTVTSLFKDEDSFVREACVKIIGYIGYQEPGTSVDFLLNKGLIDKEWNVREASIASLGNVVEHMGDKTNIISKLVASLDDEQGWVRRTSMNILAGIKEVKASQIPFEKIKINIESPDPKIREATASLLKIHAIQNIQRVFDYIIMLLEDSSEQVRQAMVDGMVKIIEKIKLKTILSELLKNLSDEVSLDLQRSVAKILERTTKYEEEKVKKRVISLLKIRCEMSQDPEICGALHKIKES